MIEILVFGCAMFSGGVLLRRLPLDPARVSGGKRPPGGKAGLGLNPVEPDWKPMGTCSATSGGMTVVLFPVFAFTPIAGTGHETEEGAAATRVLELRHKGMR